MTDLYIIGNGFDIGIGAKTSYGDFLKSDEFYNASVESAARFHKRATVITPEVRTLFTFITNSSKKDNWIDLEDHIGVFASKETTEFYHDIKELRDALHKFIKRVSEEFKNKQPKQCWASMFAGNIYDSRQECAVFTFNYTDILKDILSLYEKVYPAKHQQLQPVAHQIKHIHGSLSNGPSSIIFGIEDKRNLEHGHVYAYKSSHVKFGSPAGELRSAINAASNIHIFGHSLGVTDTMHFDALFSRFHEQTDPKKVHIYCNGEGGYWGIAGNLRRHFLGGFYGRAMATGNIMFYNVHKDIAMADGFVPIELS